MKKVFLLLSLLFILIYSNIVYANDKNMKIYIKGTGNTTIVLLSGFGTEKPLDDFKPLIDSLSCEYKMVVIEYFGYGQSDITNKERSNQVMVEEIRAALKMAQINPPYILMPHSMSGLYSLYYANNYPNEISAIIGIDASLPQKQLERWTKESFDSCKLEETSSGLNIAVVNQWNSFFDNSMELKDEKYPVDLPVLSFLATEQINAVDEMIQKKEMKTSWFQINKNMITNPNIQFIRILEGGHYLHHTQAEIISELSKQFLKNIIKA